MDPMKLLKQFNNLGCKNEKHCSIAYRVYTDLKTVCGYENVDYKYDEQHDVIYLIVSAEDQVEIYLPISSLDKIEFSKVEELQHALCQNSEKTFVLGICDPDSTVLYYSMANKWMNKEES